MSGLTRSIRIVSLVMAGVISLVMGLLLAERVIRPGIIEDFGTAALLGLVMLFVLPGMTFLALRHDRDEAVRLDGLRAGERTAVDEHREGEPEEFALPALARRMVRHTPHARPPLFTAGRSAEGPAGKGAGERVCESERVG